jgi:hypothetical protein
MPTLLHSLQKHDLGHLQIIADGWDLALSAPDARQARKRLAGHMSGSPARLRELIGDLGPEEQSALAALAGHGGQLTWHNFTQNHGEVRQMGANRRDREQPHLHPVSAAERLWYLGVIGRDFLNSPDGLVEFAYIPEDLLAILPDFLTAAPPSTPLSRPAASTETVYSYPITDQILNHSATLLAALRLGHPEWADRQIDDLTGPRPLDISFLKSLLAAASLLDEQSKPFSEPVRAFLEAPRGEALAQLAAAWLESDTHDDLALIPHMSVEGEQPRQFRTMRQAALSILRTLPPGQWWSLPALIATVKRQRPDFLRPGGDFDSWYIKDLRSDQYLRGLDHWDEVEGEYLNYIVTGPLHWLGFLELAAPHRDSPVQVFRFSPWLDALLSGQTPSLPWKEDQEVRLDSHGLLLVPRLAPRSVRYLLARFCEWGPLKRDYYTYSITPSSLARAVQDGLPVRHLTGLLQRYGAKPLPPNTLKAIQRWEEHRSQITFKHTVVLKVNHPELLEVLLNSPAKRFLGAPLGPTTISMQPGALNKVREILVGMGYLSDLDDDLA